MANGKFDAKGHPMTKSELSIYFSTTKFPRFDFSI